MAKAAGACAALSRVLEEDGRRLAPVLISIGSRFSSNQAAATFAETFCADGLGMRVIRIGNSRNYELMIVLSAWRPSTSAPLDAHDGPLREANTFEAVLAKVDADPNAFFWSGLNGTINRLS